MPAELRVIVTGSRAFGAYVWHHSQLGRVLGELPGDAVIIHGGCPMGADKMADDWAMQMGRHVVVFHADWKRHGRKAGPIRNQEMIDAGADLVIAFWDGASRGTKDCIDRAQRAGIETQVHLHGESSAVSRTSRTLSLFRQLDRFGMIHHKG